MLLLSCFSRIRLFATPQTAAHQAPPSPGFSRQEYWSGLLFPSLGNLPNLGIQPRRRQWHPTPVLLPGKSRGQRSLVGCSPWGREGRTGLSDFTLTFHFHALEKEMATHSSVLAWKIPGMGEPGGLPYLGSHRVRHD